MNLSRAPGCHSRFSPGGFWACGGAHAEGSAPGGPETCPEQDTPRTSPCRSARDWGRREGRRLLDGGLRKASADWDSGATGTGRVGPRRGEDPRLRQVGAR